MKPTKTTNKLHFEDLSFSRFEDMCVQVVYRMRNWTSIQHFGRKGKDRGVDVYTDIVEDNASEKWFIQCKRFQSLNKSQLHSIIDDLIKKNSKLPDKYIAIVACDISRDIFEDFRKYAVSKGIKHADIITASILETMLYTKHPDLLYTFFDISVLNQRAGTVTRIKRRLTLKRKIEKDFTGMRKGSNIIVRDVHRDVYPDQDFETPGIYPWFKLEYFKTYHKGVSFCIGIETVLVDTKGWWRLADYNEKIPNGWTKINALQIGDIPYDNVIDIDMEGDEYYPFPHLYCEFNNLGQPYEEIWYVPTDEYKKVTDELLKEQMIRKTTVTALKGKNVGRFNS